MQVRNSEPPVEAGDKVQFNSSQFKGPGPVFTVEFMTEYEIVLSNGSHVYPKDFESGTFTVVDA